MADPKPGTLRFTPRYAKSILKSKGVQAATSRAADRGIAGFRRGARVAGGTGNLAAKVRKEPAVGRDGRAGTRIVAYSEGNVSALFGTRRSRRVRAVGSAVRAIKRKDR